MSYEIIKIIFTDADVRTMAELAGVDEEVALDRAEDWARHITETASTMVGEQLASVVSENAP